MVDPFERLMLEKLGLENKLLDFKKITGYDLDYFIHKIMYGELEINKRTEKSNFKCHCGMEYLIKVEDEKFDFNIKYDPRKPTDYNSFHCIKCMRRIIIVKKIKGIEVLNYE